MKRNTCLTLTNCAAPAKRSKKFPSSIEKTRARLAAGSGTAIALSVGGLLVGTMRHPRKRRGTRDCGNGGRTIQKQRLSLMQSAGGPRAVFEAADLWGVVADALLAAGWRRKGELK